MSVDRREQRSSGIPNFRSWDDEKTDEVDKRISKEIRKLDEYRFMKAN